MAWDSSRPVPWQRLMREWVIYALIMVAVFLVFFRDANVIGAIVGVLISGPLYLALGTVLAKFGYQRKTFREARTERQEQLAERDAASTSSGSTAHSSERPKPPPTRRTQQGSNRPRSSSKRKR
ncbi:MAG: hypothetical protein AAGF73_01635 [Actinomycetota bacterium]